MNVRGGRGLREFWISRPPSGVPGPNMKLFSEPRIERDLAASSVHGRHAAVRVADKLVVRWELVTMTPTRATTSRSLFDARRNFKPRALYDVFGRHSQAGQLAGLPASSGGQDRWEFRFDGACAGGAPGVKAWPSQKQAMAEPL